MTGGTAPSEFWTHQPYRRRNADQDLELWKHHAGFGGEDKNRMVTIASWLLGFSAALLAYAMTSLTGKSLFNVLQPQKAVVVAAIGAGLSLMAGYTSLLYGGYANRNWEEADRIARRWGWTDLLPTNELTGLREILRLASKPGLGLNTIAKRYAHPCQPTERLAPVFHVFLLLAVLSFVANAVFAVVAMIDIA